MTVILDQNAIIEAYRKAEKRILFLDYDGTLVPFSDLPGDSNLGEEIKTILMDLSADRKNSIYIISGRDKEFLTNQFMGIRVGLVAEHGFFIKEAKGRWKKTTTFNSEWKKTAIMCYTELTDRYPGTFLEEKESSVAFHYRTAEKDVGKKLRPVILKQLLILKREYPGLDLLDGDKVYEFKPMDFNKGLTANTILKKENKDFIMAAGDDLSDESLFTELPDTAFTIKIGSPPTCARYIISGQKKFIGFLKHF